MKGLTAASPAGEGAAAGTASPRGDGDARGWLAGYLGRFPRDAAVPRGKLRNIAGTRWPDAADRPLPLSQSRQPHRRMEGRSGPDKGRRSSQKLADCLRSFEELGLIRRDNAQDTVIITDPAGLLKLAGAQSASRP